MKLTYTLLLTLISTFAILFIQDIEINFIQWNKKEFVNFLLSFIFNFQTIRLASIIHNKE